MATNWRVAALQIVAALALTIVRHLLATDRFGWDSFYTFGGSWVVHWIALWLMPGFSWIAISRYHRFFTGKDEKIGFDEFAYYAAMMALVASVMMLLGHYGPIDDLD